MRIGINAFPLRAEGGGGRFVFTGLVGALLRLDTQNRYLIFTHLEGLRIVYQVLVANGETAGNAADSRVRVIQIADEGQIYTYRYDFDIYFGPLNNLNPRIHDRPTLGMLLDIQEQYYPEYFAKSELVARQEAYPEICHCSTIVLTISEFCKQTFVEKFGVDPKKIEVVYLAPQPALADRDVDEAGRWTRGDLPKDYLFYPANAYKHKNHKLLLEAAGILKEAGRPVPLVFSGYELPGGFPLRKEIAERGLVDLCHHFTELPVDELRYLYRNALATAIPTMFEGFCIPAIEAMACGCPVLCSDLPVLHEVAGDAALYFSSSNPRELAGKIEQIRNDPDLRASCARGYANAKRFNWDASGRQLLDVFRRARERFVWADHKPGTVQRPRIGVTIRLVRGGAHVGATVQSLLVTGYPDLIIRCTVAGDLPAETRQFLASAGVEVVRIDRAGAPDGEDLLNFARENKLDMVGEILEGNRFKPTAFDSLGSAYLNDPTKVAYLGEAFEWRGEQFAGIARMRLTGDQLWKLEGFLYPELLFLNPKAMAEWPEGAAYATRSGNEWRWELLREARRNNRLCMMRRTLADCDRMALPPEAGKQAARSGMFDYYNAANEHSVKVRLLRRMEPIVKRAARVLPMKWQDAGTRLWYHLAR